MRAVYLVGRDAHVAIARIRQQHIAAVALHVIHLVAFHRHVVHILHSHGVVVLTAEITAFHHTACGANVGCPSADVNADAATHEGAASDGEVVSITAVEHGHDAHAGRRRSHAVKETAALETAVRTVQAQSNHIGQRAAAAHEVYIAEPYVVHVGKVDHILRARRSIGVDSGALTGWLEHYVVLLCQAVHLGHGKRRIAAGSQPHHQRVIHPASAQREKELLYGVVVGVLTAYVTNTVQRTCADDKRREAGVVVRLMVTHGQRARRQRVANPGPQLVIAGSQGDARGHGHRHRLLTRQRAIPREAAKETVVNAVAYHRRRQCFGTEVLQLYVDMRRLRNDGRLIVGEHQRCHTGIVLQRLVLVHIHHQCRALVVYETRLLQVRVCVGVGVVGGLQTPVALGLLCVGVRHHLDAHRRRVYVAVVDALHHDVRSCVVERILEVNPYQCTCRSLPYGERRIPHHLHIVRRVGLVVHIRRHRIAVGGVLQAELVVGAALRRGVAGNDEAHGGHGSGTVASLCHKRRVYNPLVTRVGKLNERYVRRRRRARQCRRHVLRRILRAAHAPVFHPCVSRCRIGGLVGIHRRIPHHTVEAHHRVVAIERYAGGKTAVCDVVVTRIVTRVGHGQPHRRQVAAHRVIQIGRVGIDALRHVGPRIHHHARATAARMGATVGVKHHVDLRVNHLVLAGADTYVVYPPTSTSHVTRLSPLLQHEAEYQAALLSRHRRA